jgi:hypothetical protein
MTFPNNVPNYVPPALVETSPANPVAPASTAAFKMQGLGALFTPATGNPNALAIIQGNILSAVVTAANGISLQLYYGPMVAGVAAPANGAAIPAAAIALGGVKTFTAGTTLTAAADMELPFNIAGLAKGLVQGQQYWFDLAAESVGTASDYSLTNVDVILTEIS